METNYIACLTSYPPRMQNLPQVIDSLWGQSIPPKKIVLTIARSDYAEMQPVLEDLDCDILVVENDVRVFKKFLYAMDKYCKKGEYILCCDDDKIYEEHFALFMRGELDSTRPRLISGNTYWHNGFKCHCGCASLVFPAAFKGWRNYEKYFDTWESDDMFYTMLAAKNGYTYVAAHNDWETELQALNPVNPYSTHGMVQRTYVEVAKAFKWI